MVNILEGFPSMNVEEVLFQEKAADKDISGRTFLWRGLERMGPTKWVSNLCGSGRVVIWVRNAKRSGGRLVSVTLIV